MPSVVLVSPQNAEVTVSSTFEFNSLVYSAKYRPKTGTIAEAFAILLGSNVTPVPDPSRHATVGEVGSLAAAAPEVRAASLSAGRTYTGPALPADYPAGEYVWNKTDGSGVLLDIISGVKA